MPCDRMSSQCQNVAQFAGTYHREGRQCHFCFVFGKICSWHSCAADAEPRRQASLWSSVCCPCFMLLPHSITTVMLLWWGCLSSCRCFEIMEICYFVYYKPFCSVAWQVTSDAALHLDAYKCAQCVRCYFRAILRQLCLAGSECNINRALIFSKERCRFLALQMARAVYTQICLVDSILIES